MSTEAASRGGPPSATRAVGGEVHSTRESFTSRGVTRPPKMPKRHRICSVHSARAVHQLPAAGSMPAAPSAAGGRAPPASPAPATRVTVPPRTGPPAGDTDRSVALWYRKVRLGGSGGVNETPPSSETLTLAAPTAAHGGVGQMISRSDAWRGVVKAVAAGGGPSKRQRACSRDTVVRRAGEPRSSKATRSSVPPATGPAAGSTPSASSSKYS